MGKTYIDTVKYMIRANFEVDGIIEKPDIVGAIFGQTEGLLGDELDLRELQKNGRIGRIEVDTQVRGGKTSGQIHVPSSLDMAETSILAASLEVVDRVGPCEARITVAKIEDSRNLKRKQVLDRAKNLLKTMITDEIPESKQLTELVRDDVKVAEIGTYGDDKLPAGPEVARSNEVIVVEGRADVINLLKNGMKNAVAVGGANVGKTIAQLCNEKEVTVFLDGDRGGDIILKELQAVAEIDFVARAPTGKEVEELTRKEMIQCLRRRVPLDQAAAEKSGNGNNGGNGRGDRERGDRNNDRNGERNDRSDSGRSQRHEHGEDNGRQVPQFRRPQMPPIPSRHSVDEPRHGPIQSTSEPRPVPSRSPAVAAVASDGSVPEALTSALKELEGSLKARVLSESFETISEVPIRDIMRALGDAPSVGAIVLDGIVTQRLVDLAEMKKAAYVVGVRSGTIMRKPTGTKIVVSE